jgi:tetratricopeptide (TPR) repeat protein
VPPASHGRARVLAARVAGRSGDLAAAEAQLDLARALLPEPDADPAFSGVAGNLAARRGRFRQARLHYQRVLAADPGPADAQRAWVGLAKVRLARGDPDGATRLLARAPRDAAALATLAQIHQRAGRYDAAGRALDRARRASVGDAAALASIDGLRAALAVDAGDLAGAECAYAELQQRHARRGDRAARAIATGNRASVRVVQGRVDGVDELLDEALVAHRATGDHKLVTTCLATRGQLRQLQGRPDDAVECYDDAAALAAEGGAWADWATVRTMGAVALAEAGRLDDARRWLEGLGDLGVPDHVQRAERALRRCEGAPVPDAPTPGNDDVARWLDRRAEASVTHPNRHRPARA